MQFTTLFSVLAFAATLASASPLILDNFIRPATTSDFKAPTSNVVVTPTILRPVGNETYPVGSVQTIVWDTSKIPSEAQNYTGEVLLGYSEAGSSSENLDIEHPLSVGFPLNAGQVNYTVPDVQDRTTYFLVLLGDSGNKSPEFGIEHGA